MTPRWVGAFPIRDWRSNSPSSRWERRRRTSPSAGASPATHRISLHWPRTRKRLPRKSKAASGMSCLPLRNLNRDQLIPETALLLRGNRFLVRGQCKLILCVAGDAPALGDVLRRLSHLLEGELDRQSRIGKAPTQRGVIDFPLARGKAVRGLGHRPRSPSH